MRLREAIFGVDRAQRGHRLVDLAPGIADRGIANAPGLQLALASRDPRQQGRIIQCPGSTDRAFQFVLDTVKDVGAFPDPVRILTDRHDQAPAQLRLGGKSDRKIDLALEGELAHRQHALGRSGVADDEDELALDRLAPGPFQMLRSRDRLPVLVCTQKRAIESITRKIVIVGVAAELGRGALGGPGDPDVRIFAVDVQLVLAAAVQHDDLAAGFRGVRTSHLFDRCNGRGSRLDRRLSGR